ncbi:hypothetical protein SCHPADRAFT_902985 [Schizopora paradoxa]|uniref:NAD(P)-binding domain-containing protein n=1 Tax=Schizopora paradoxa TaxID=27342 RepID=A0A0H2RZ90_9AGAM|nr:hypothetical protein SCHPADRAFT_902985 [Schizopora paradoxa]
MKLILTGATGAAGIDILRAALADPAISQVTVLSRSALPSTIQQSSKLNVITHKDFSSYPPDLIQGPLAGHNACIWAQGKSSRGMSEQAYTELTYDWPMEAIKAFHEGGLKGENGEPFRFVYVSGEGVDRSGKGWAMFSRVKGRAETDLLEYSNATQGVFRTLILRPGYFFPSDPVDARRLRPGFERYLDPVFGSLLRACGLGIHAQDLGRASVAIAKGEDGIVGKGDYQELFRNNLLVNIAKSLNKQKSL